MQQAQNTRQAKVISRTNADTPSVVDRAASVGTGIIYGLVLSALSYVTGMVLSALLYVTVCCLIGCCKLCFRLIAVSLSYCGHQLARLEDCVCVLALAIGGGLRDGCCTISRSIRRALRIAFRRQAPGRRPLDSPGQQKVRFHLTSTRTSVLWPWSCGSASAYYCKLCLSQPHGSAIGSSNDTRILVFWKRCCPNRARLVPGAVHAPQTRPKDHAYTRTVN